MTTTISKTDDTGAKTWAANYEAFGTRTDENGTNEDRQKANTKEEDPHGLLNEGMRYRDLEAGIFITRDPAGFVDGPNVYTYVRQNPWTFYDPYGLYSWLDGVQDTLSGAGLIPAVGIIPDAANTLISLGRGNWADAGMNGLAMIPIAGQVATGAKYADKAIDAGKAIDKANDARKAAFGSGREMYHLLLAFPLFLR